MVYHDHKYRYLSAVKQMFYFNRKFADEFSISDLKKLISHTIRATFKIYNYIFRCICMHVYINIKIANAVLANNILHA